MPSSRRPRHSLPDQAQQDAALPIAGLLDAGNTSSVMTGSPSSPLHSFWIVCSAKFRSPVSSISLALVKLPEPLAALLRLERLLALFQLLLVLREGRDLEPKVRPC